MVVVSVVAAADDDVDISVVDCFSTDFELEASLVEVITFVFVGDGASSVVSSAVDETVVVCFSTGFELKASLVELITFVFEGDCGSSVVSLAVATNDDEVDETIVVLSLTGFELAASLVDSGDSSAFCWLDNFFCL